MKTVTLVLMKTVTLVTSTFGNINVVLKENPNFPNTLEIGSKLIDFTDILPLDYDLRKEKEYDVIIWDGMKPYVNIIVGSNTYVGTINIPSVKHEELLVH